MKTRSEWVAALIAMSLAVGLGWAISSPEPLPPVVAPPDTVTITVLEYLPSDTITVKSIVRDTVYIDQGGDTVNTYVASMDTTFADSAGISIDYFIEPEIFGLRYTPAPLKTIITKIPEPYTVYVDSSAWWNKFKYGTYVGVSITAILVSMLN